MGLRYFMKWGTSLDVDKLKQRLVEVWSGLAYGRPLSMTQSTNGEDVSRPVFE